MWARLKKKQNYSVASTLRVKIWMLLLIVTLNMKHEAHVL